jgi:hypothetical protein
MQPPSLSRPGRPLPEGRMDVVHSMEVVTPHVKWADPYSRGPLRAWLMPNVIGGRDVIELAQRLSLHYDTLTFDEGGYNAWGFGDFYGRRGGPGTTPNYEIDHGYLVEDLTSAVPYDVLVLPGTHPWHELPAEARAAVARRVREGAGLVLISPRCDPARLGELADLSPLLPIAHHEERMHEDSWKETKPVAGSAWQAAAPHFITSGVPLSALPAEHIDLLPCQAAGEVLITASGSPVLAVKPYGAGRVAAFGYDNSCFSPKVNDPWHTELTYPYWEYYYSLLCRALLWAAHREPDVRLADLSAAGGRVTAALEGASRPATASITFRDERYHEERTVQVDAAHLEAPIPSDLNGGLHFADVVLRDERGTLDWGTATFDVPRGASISALRVERDVVPVGDNVLGEVTFATASPGTVTVDLRFEDNYGRVLDRARYDLDVEGEVTAPFTLATAHCLTRLGRVVCEMLQNDRLLDQKTTDLFGRTPQVWDDYEIIMDRFLPEPAPGRWPEIEKRLAEMNVSVMGAISPVMAEHVNAKLQADVVAYGFHPRHYATEWNRVRKGYLATRDKQYLVRKPCFLDPSYRERFRDDLTAKVTSFVRFSPISYYAYEEPSLTHYRGGLDLCWCPVCLAGFRAWLRETYGTLDAVNGEWGSSFSAWDEVMPFTTEEAQAAGRYAPWADYRTWMEVMWADTYRLGHDVIRGLDPHAVICLSGNQEGTPFNGYDYSRLNRHLHQMQLYGSENLDEINRSFYPGMLLTGCTGYGISNPYLALQLWGWLLNGDTAGVVIFWEISCLNPDLTLCKSGRDLAQHFGELRGGGIARLLNAATRDNCGIAIHYSYPSFHGTWITDGEIVDHEWSSRSSQAFAMLNRDRMAWTQLLEGLGYQYDFVSYDQIEEGFLRENGYRLLILPDSVAMSDKEAKAVEEFVAAGGVVISDIWPTVMNEHCTWRGGGALDLLFGIQHEGVQSADFTRIDPGERVRTTEAEQGWCEGHPGVARRHHGEGEAIYLGASLTPLFSERGVSDRAQLTRLSDLAAKLLAEAGITPPARIVNRSGRPVTTCESAHYRAGAADYFGLVRYPATPEEQDMLQQEASYTVPLESARGALERDDGAVRITFPEARHVYDIRQRRYLGHTDTVEATLSYGDATLLARLPYRVAGLRVTGPASVAPGQAVDLSLALDTDGDSAAGDHVAAVWVYAPDGTRRRHYDCRIVMPKGRGAGSIPLALSDTPGPWRAVIRDVATGTEAEHRFTVAQSSPLAGEAGSG